MSDSFGKFAGIAIEKVVDGGAQVLGTVVAGPGGGVLATVAVGWATNWLRSKASGNDDAFREERLGALEDEFLKFDARLLALEAARAAAGLPAEPRNPLQTEAVLSEFAKAVSEAPSPEKRAALVNVAVNQFDPRFGSVAERDFWFKRVRALSDMDVVAIQQLSLSPVALIDGQLVPVPDAAPEEFMRGESVALEIVIRTMASASGMERIVQEGDRSMVPFKLKTYSTSVYSLTSFGKKLASLIG